ncbi:hypothetical protein [Nocardia sp. alder85J]|uniref:hypothetical protein n=1 Tax=Nocardia sp. alder85J TaxID=2862949 RepID=UPI001CD7C0B0|nr:hypothetical protein [Nocardia sp. alder85J]MCX4097697.1 hypothetical protein [Nocardia sp. alder85J]
MRRPRHRARRSRPWASLAVAVTLLLWMVVGAGIASAIDNPLGGVAPRFDLFGTALDAAWKRVVAAIWAAVLIGCSVRVVVGAYKVRSAKQRGYSNDLSEGMDDVRDALVALGLAGLASPIVGAILFVVGG